MGWHFLVPMFIGTSLSALSGICLDASIKEIRKPTRRRRRRRRRGSRKLSGKALGDADSEGVATEDVELGTVTTPKKPQTVVRSQSRAAVGEARVGGSNKMKTMGERNCSMEPISRHNSSTDGTANSPGYNGSSAISSGSSSSAPSPSSSFGSPVHSGEACADDLLSPTESMLIASIVSLSTFIVGVFLVQLLSRSKEPFSWLLVRDLNNRVLHLKSFAPFLAGALQFFSNYLETKAFETASSTVVTPLLQLSAVWMLPISTSLAALGFVQTDIIHPIHFVGILHICIGGLLPAAGGDMRRFTRLSFWGLPAVRYCIIGELGICLYSLLLHYATYEVPPIPSPLQMRHDRPVESQETMGTVSSILRFFLLSRLGHGLSALLILKPDFSWMWIRETSPPSISVPVSFEEAKTPAIEADASLAASQPQKPSQPDIALNIGMRKDAPSEKGRRDSGRLLVFGAVSPIAYIGHLLANAGAVVVMFSYSIFYEPSVVNALEGGSLQLINLIMAALAHRFCEFGRPVTGVRTKLISFLMITFGVYLTSLE